MGEGGVSLLVKFLPGEYRCVDCADPYFFPDVVSPTAEESNGLQSVGSGKLPFL